MGSPGGLGAAGKKSGDTPRGGPGRPVGMRPPRPVPRGDGVPVQVHVPRAAGGGPWPRAGHMVKDDALSLSTVSLFCLEVKASECSLEQEKPDAFCFLRTHHRSFTIFRK